MAVVREKEQPVSTPPADFSASVDSMVRSARAAFRKIRASSTNVRNAILLKLADRLVAPATMSVVLKANAADLVEAKKNGLSEAMVDRLLLNEKRLQSIAASVREIAAFPDPVGEVLGGGTLKSGVEMVKKRVPLGVIFVVYESRPNVTIDVGALAIKSGNAAILRGGKEAILSNLALFEVFSSVLDDAGLGGSLSFVKETDRSYMAAVLLRDDMIDLVVPRGGEGLIRFVSENSRIPVVKHDKGVCNLYVDESADLKIALDVARNAKLQRPSVCNSIENLLIHSKFAKSRELLSGLKQAGARLLGDARTVEIFPETQLIADPDVEYSTEYLDNRLAVKIVASVDEAVDFIYRYGSAHSEAIIAQDSKATEAFIHALDSAAVFVNCSTRFHDGGEMGMGAEVGISTARLHVRGPMGVRDLTTTTYVVRGRGEIRG